MNLLDNDKGLSTLATLNFVLALFGYQLIASVFMPFMKVGGDSQLFTLPYRAFVLGLSLYLIFRSGGRFHTNQPILVKCLALYWGILIIRLVYDFYVQSLMPMDAKRNFPIVLYVFGIIIPTAVAFLRTYDKVNYKKALMWSIAVLLIVAICNYLFNPTLFLNTGGRVSGGIALNTISFGHCGVSLSLLSLYLGRYESHNKGLHYRILVTAMFAVGLYIMIRAGSRGPLVVFLLLLLLFYSFGRSNYLFVIFSLLGTALLVYLLRDLLLSFINDIQPVAYERILATINKGDLSGRQSLYQKALDIWYTNLAFGGQFSIYHYVGGRYVAGYSHNIILDSLVAGGMVGGALMLYFFYNSFRFLRICTIHCHGYAWLALIFLQKFLSCLSSGCFYMDSLLTIGIIVFAVLGKIKTQDVASGNQA